LDKKIEETGCTDREVLRISFQQILFLADETQKVFPVEACGVLFGRRLSEEETKVERIVMIPNALNSTTEFRVDPETLAAVFAANEKDGLKHIGFFHSHPYPYHSLPLAEDIEYMKLWSKAETVWLILSTIKYEGLSAFKMKKGNLEKVILHIYKEP
jgi:proteasome lid subunit RPN8/RPN11